MSLPNGFEDFAVLLRGAVDEAKKLGSEIIATRGNEPVPYIGPKTSDPVVASRRKLAELIGYLVNYYGDMAGMVGPHPRLIAHLIGHLEFYFHRSEADYQVADGCEYEFLAFFYDEVNHLYRFETPRFEGCIEVFEQFSTVFSELIKNDQFEYFLDNDGYFTATDESGGNGKELPSAKYALPPPGPNGGRKPSRNELRKVIRMYEGKGRGFTAQQIANEYNQRYGATRGKATADMVRYTKRRMNADDRLSD